MKRFRMEAKEVMPIEKTFARLEYTGTINLVKHQFLTVRCQYYILLFPFDVQQCRMPFGSWAYTMEHVEVEAFDSRLAQQIFEVMIEGRAVLAARVGRTLHYDSLKQYYLAESLTSGKFRMGHNIVHWNKRNRGVREF